MDRTDIFDAAFSGLPALPGIAAGEFFLLFVP